MIFLLDSKFVVYILSSVFCFLVLILFVLASVFPVFARGWFLWLLLIFLSSAPVSLTIFLSSLFPSLSSPFFLEHAVFIRVLRVWARQVQSLEVML